jgi:hypothetical protein
MPLINNRIMTTNQALEFLSQYQPMPNDDNIDETLIGLYNDVRKYFLTNKDVRCIPLFLNSFGYINGHGVYQLVENVIAQYNQSEVLPYLIKSLQSNYYGVKYWSTQIASRFTSKELVLPISKLLTNEDFDIKYAALTALEQNEDHSSVIEAIIAYIENETEEELLTFAHEIIEKCH